MSGDDLTDSEKVLDEALRAFAAGLDENGCPLPGAASSSKFVPRPGGGFHASLEGGDKPQVFAFDGATVDEEAKLCEACNSSPCVLSDVDPDLDQDKTLYEYLAHVGESMQDGGQSNKEIRYELYRIATKAINGHLGKGNRKKLPTCVTADIKDLFPESTGDYVGFKKGFLNE
jgi:hypothetical protein